MEADAKPRATTADRVHWVDGLRGVIVYGIGLYHIALVFSITTWLVANPTHSWALSLFAAFSFTWGIPALFFVAGADAWFFLRRRSAAAFARARLLRLGFPMVAGAIVLTPLQRYFTFHNPPPPLADLPSFYGYFFTSIRLDWGKFWPSLYAFHLWFLVYLLAISLSTLPVLAWLRGRRARRARILLEDLFRRRLGVLAFVVPLCIGQLLTRPWFPGLLGPADVVTYTFVYVSGAVLVMRRDFEAGILRTIRPALIGGAIVAPALGAMTYLNIQNVAVVSTYPMRLLYALLWGINTWCWLLVVLYVGIRWLNRPHRAIRYMSDSAIAFYIIHHPIVLGVASVVVTWNLGVWPKAAIIVLAVYALTVAIFEGLVRHFNPARVVFGLKPRPRRRRSLRRRPVESPGA